VKGWKDILEEIRVRSISEGSRELARRFNFLPYMIERYSFLSDDLTGFISSLLKRGEHVILCNYLKFNCEEVIEELGDMGFSFERIRFVENSLSIKSSPRSPTIGSTHLFFKGAYYVYRDFTSLIPPIILNPKEGERVLDVASSPGGKAFHLLLRMKDRGLLIANEAYQKRVSPLKNNMIRMCLRSYVITNFKELPFNNEFERVLIDAPCSGEGIIMYDPSRRTRTSQEDLAKLVEREIRLLRSSVLSSKGYILYSTCSIAPEENEYVISAILEEFKGKIEVVEPPFNYWGKGLEEFMHLKFNPEVKKCIRIYPKDSSGFFICLLRKLFNY
jgi:16S rRNA C967 or C1407 C5-methylase (RsmB/RsmF family)